MSRNDGERALPIASSSEENQIIHADIVWVHIVAR